MREEPRALIWLLLGWLMSTSVVIAQPARQPENLGKNVNSEHQELLPVISPDGLRLYFARKNHPENYLSPQESQEIWYSEYDARSDKWGAAVHMTRDFNSQQINGISSISPDGNTIMVRASTEAGQQQVAGFALRTRMANGWSEPEILVIEGIEQMAKGVFMGGTLAGDGRTLLLYFSETLRSETNDLYVSFLQEDGSWSQPSSLGEPINTADYSEVAPFLAADGKTLYFASNRSGGQGDYDIYKSQRQGNGWTQWSDPVNLGEPINTPSFEAYYTIAASGEYAYMVSEQNAIGQSDIIRIPLTEAQKPDPVVLVSGKATDMLSGTPVAVNLVYELPETGEVVGQGLSNATDGSYKLTLPYGNLYEIVATAENYETTVKSLDLTVKRDYQVMEVNLGMTPLEGAASATPPEMMADPFGTLLSSVYFTGRSLKIQDDAEVELNLVLKMLQGNPSLSMVIQGHADVAGSHNTNMALSKYRAQQARAWMIARGIGPHRLPTIGYGNTKPATLSRSTEGLKLNNRVEFHFNR